MKTDYMGFLSGLLEIKNRIIGLFYTRKKKVSNKAARGHKTVLTSKDTLMLNGSTKLKVENVTKNAKVIMKQYINDPEALLAFIESKGTQVIKAPHIEKVLILIGESEGFIFPLKGMKALILSLAINILSGKRVKIGFETHDMFVMRNERVNIYFLAHQFHHWLSYLKGLPGYEEDTIENFKNIWSNDFGSEDIDKMSIDEILSLKDAIARDIDAIKFVKEIAREFVGSKTSLNKLQNGQSVNI